MNFFVVCNECVGIKIGNGLLCIIIIVMVNNWRGCIKIRRYLIKVYDVRYSLY